MVCVDKTMCKDVHTHTYRDAHTYAHTYTEMYTYTHTHLFHLATHICNDCNRSSSSLRLNLDHLNLGIFLATAMEPADINC